MSAFLIDFLQLLAPPCTVCLSSFQLLLTIFVLNGELVMILHKCTSERSEASREIKLFRTNTHFSLQKEWRITRLTRNCTNVVTLCSLMCQTLKNVPTNSIIFKVSNITLAYTTFKLNSQNSGRIPFFKNQLFLSL